MVCKIPDNWVYDDSLEMLYLFYQRADELLSETSPDTYSLPLHNPITLVREIEEVFNLLNQYGMLADYYKNYIPPIIDEFLKQSEDDYILKKILGNRLDSIRTGFNEALQEHRHLDSWINTFKQACSMYKYRSAYKAEIVRLVTETKDKDKLLCCMCYYFTSLVSNGYSREYLYVMTKKFFANADRKITDLHQIKEFLEIFNCRYTQFDFLILMDVDSIEYMDSISDNLKLSRQIERVNTVKERKELCRDYVAEALFKEYDTMIHEPNHKRKMAVVRFWDDSLDPYSAAERFCDYVRFLQTFTRYFKHHYFTKQVYRIIYRASDGHYKEIKLHKKMLKRPIVEQETIDKRIRCILQARSLGYDAFHSLTQAIEMHAEAFDARNTTTLLRTFWTATETLFSNQKNHTRENVINSLLAIIQKTYILKNLRVIYAQVCSAIDIHDLKELGIADFDSFVKYYAIHAENSKEMKAVYAHLSQNPLLRTRLFGFRKKLSSAKNIAKYLDAHKTRVEWQLKRIYRMRNIATHLGVEIQGTESAANHLHNYFDYAVNYMLCKSENGDYVESTATVVFEAKNDNQIYGEILKSTVPLSEDNYLSYLFGPDYNLVKYQFE